MKKHLFTLLTIFFTSLYIFAQAPEKMSYQSIVRNSDGNLLTTSIVGMQISILQGSISGTSVYSETHTATTGVNGLVSLEIGTGTTSDIFSTIDWANGPYFVKVETDPNGGTNYSISGTSQLLSVPYALYAATSGSSTPGPKGDAGEQGIQGEKGDQGDAGTPGIQGIQGEKGDQGDAGTPGIQGIQGEKGDQGDAGTPGLQGIQGEKGDQGDAGTPGLQGIQGEKGDQGDAGTPGTDGKTLLSGTADPQAGDGSEGDFYINSTSNQIFGPKTVGGWGSGTTLSAVPSAGNLAQLDVTINGTTVTDSPTNHKLLGVSAASKTLLTDKGFLYEVNGTALYNAFPVYTDAACTGTPIYVYYQPSENGGATAPGMVFGNASDTFYIPTNATVQSVTYMSFNNLQTGACNQFTETGSVYPILPNDSAVTGYNFGANNLNITITSK